ncbi:MAG: MFS transporter [Anaerolineales bacterium]
MPSGLRARLSIMMFLEFFTWGAWYSVLSVYVENPPSQGGLGFSVLEKGDIYGLLALASIFMPLLAGQVTDRWVPTQVFLGLAHLAGAIGLFYAARQQEYGPVYSGVLLWSLAYAPTISLTNSLAFSHLKDAEKDFGLVRVFGTIGWIAAGLALTTWRGMEGLAIGGNDCLYLAGGSGVAMALYCFTLPHTPPARTGVSPWAFLEALSLLRDPRIAVFLVISFVVGTELPFYFTLTGNFLQHLGTDQRNIPALMTIGQVAEILTMLALPWFLKKLGPRKTLFLGVLAWPVRYLIFALGGPYELVVASLALHGVCFVFFFVVAFIYIDSVAPKDIKASAQGLLTLVIYGFGMWLGNKFTVRVQDYFTAEDSSINWTGVFLVPSVLTILCAVVLFLTFPKGSIREASAAAEGAPS